MFKKIIEFNQATQVWWEKQQGKLTKTQHIIFTCILLYFVFYNLLQVQMKMIETTFFNYYLPFLVLVKYKSGSFCGNAIFYGKYKKKK